MDAAKMKASLLQQGLYLLSSPHSHEGRSWNETRTKMNEIFFACGDFENLCALGGGNAKKNKKKTEQIFMDKISITWVEDFKLK